jgi:hypothetical protein
MHGELVRSMSPVIGRLVGSGCHVDGEGTQAGRVGAWGQPTHRARQRLGARQPGREPSQVTREAGTAQSTVPGGRMGPEHTPPAVPGNTWGHAHRSSHRHGARGTGAHPTHRFSHRHRAPEDPGPPDPPLQPTAPDPRDPGRHPRPDPPCHLPARDPTAPTPTAAASPSRLPIPVSTLSPPRFPPRALVEQTIPFCYTGTEQFVPHLGEDPDGQQRPHHGTQHRR